ncbi:MAG: F0F1 ATP synthase subunit A [Pyrinomonadaceae bacterium]|nr:F0F1 ATP synthase subunit A [Pyrinomonadaceae bacterium]
MNTLKPHKTSKPRAQWLRLLLVSLFLGLSVEVALPVSAEPGADQAISANAAKQSEPATSLEKMEHGLSQGAVEIGRIFGFPVSNSMMVSWFVAFGLIIFARFATRRMDRVPSGAQNFLEWLIESLYGFLESLLGKHLVDRTFWYFATVFIFILSANWVGLIPGVGTIGWGHATSHGFTIDQPLLRGANADVNMTLAMALVFFACWIVWALREIGPGGFLKELFAPKGESTGVLRVVLVVVFFIVGCLEVISILFRPVSLSFRLYGNTFAGENMLETMAGVVPSLGWLLPVPFYFLELLVGVVQALVFMLLTAVFTLLICQHEEKPKATRTN